MIGVTTNKAATILQHINYLGCSVTGPPRYGGRPVLHTEIDNMDKSNRWRNRQNESETS